MRHWLSLLIPFSVLGCALPGEVQRESVEYNTAVAAMANQLTLLNIVRAKEGMPTFYTSIKRLTGSVTVQGSAGFNAQIKASQPTVSNSTTSQTGGTSGETITNTSGTTGSITNTSSSSIGSTMTNVSSNMPSSTNAVTSSSGTMLANATGTATTYSNVLTSGAANTVTNLMQTAVTKGGNIFSPSVGGQVQSGPSFDIDILDTQLFYQGVLAEIPFGIVDNYIDQDYDNQLLIRLLVLRVEFTLAKNEDSDKSKDKPDDIERKLGYKVKPGDTVKILRNVAHGEDAREFANELACFKLSGAEVRKPPVQIAPLSRVTEGANGQTMPLKLSDLALFSDQTLSLSSTVSKGSQNELGDPKVTISSDPKHDADVMISRPATTTKIAKLLPLMGPCYRALAISELHTGVVPPKQVADTSPPPDALYSDGSVQVADVHGNPVSVPVKIKAVFRSPEGVIRFLGQYLFASENYPDETYGLTSSVPIFSGGKQAMRPMASPLFSVQEGADGGSLVSASLSGKRYYIANDANHMRNMTIVGLVEQLVDLQKSSQNRPDTLAVQVVP